MEPSSMCMWKSFLSTLSLRRATVLRRGPRHQRRLFYPRSPCGERLLGLSHSFRHNTFLSTLSLRRATRIIDPTYGQEVFLSTLSLRRATLSVRSAHHVLASFLSTLSLRRATWQAAKALDRLCFFYPRSPCGERPFRAPTLILSFWIFLSTLSLRRATTVAGSCRNGVIGFSIHALLAESDAVKLLMFRRVYHFFYPRSPCGERLFIVIQRQAILLFYPRSPCGERLFRPSPHP